MSEIDSARRCELEIFFEGVNISSSIAAYLNSLTFTDNEEDESDDLQIKLHDRDGLWLESWLNNAITAAAENDTDSNIKYMVTEQGGLIVYKSKKTSSEQLGRLSYGTVLSVESTSNGWAEITYSDEKGYVKSSGLQVVYTEVSAKSSSTGTTTAGWSVGQSVIANGRPQYSSYGNGTPGANVTNYKGTITRLNLKSGIPYPICVGQLGWFAESQVTSESTSVSVGEVSDEASKGLKIQASIIRRNTKGNGEDDKLYCGQFDLDSVDVQGPPSSITIKATSLPYSSTMRQVKKSRSWESYSLSGIAKEMAENNNMSCMFLSDSDPSYDRREQYYTSDIVFLQELCRNAGLSLKVTDNLIVIFDQATYEQKSVVRTIKRGKEGRYEKYKLATASNDTYTSCRVSHVDSSGKLIEAVVYADDYDAEKDEDVRLEIQQKVSSIAEAKKTAEKQLKLRNKYEFTAAFTLPGDTSLVAGCTVALEDWGAWSGNYIIKQSKHSVSSSGYTTQITLRKAG